MEDCHELQRTYDRTLDLEHQYCINMSELRAKLVRNLSTVGHPWPEEEDGGEIVPVRESYNERKSDAQFNKILLTTPILRENLSVQTCHNNWRTAEVSLVEKSLRTLKQFFMESQIALREDFFQWSHQVQNVGYRRTARRKRVFWKSEHKMLY